MRPAACQARRRQVTKVAHYLARSKRCDEANDGEEGMVRQRGEES